MPSANSHHPRVPPGLLPALVTSIGLALAGCGGGPPNDSDPAVPGIDSADSTRNCGPGEWKDTADPEQKGMFVDISDEVGLDFRRAIGPLGTYFLPEINGSGGAMFDYDGDGDLDVVATGWSPDGRIAWFENPGDPTHKWAMRMIKDHWSNAVTVVLADLDRDGRLDIVACAERGANEIRWWRNLGK